MTPSSSSSLPMRPAPMPTPPAEKKKEGMTNQKSPEYELQLLPSFMISPLGREYCLYYSILMHLAVYSGIFVLITLIFSAKKYSIGFFANLIGMFLLYGITYLANRIMYSMCQASL